MLYRLTVEIEGDREVIGEFRGQSRKVLGYAHNLAKKFSPAYVFVERKPKFDSDYSLWLMRSFQK